MTTDRNRPALLALLAGAALAALTAVSTAQGPTAPPKGVANPATSAEVFATPLARSALRERAIALVVEATQSDSPLLRANGIEALQPVPTRVEPIARAALTDANFGVRYTAVMTIAELKLCESAPLVRPLLADREPVVVGAAILALERCGADPDPSPLAALLFSSVPRERSIGAVLLGEMGDPSAIPMLKAAVKVGDGVGLPVEHRLLQIQIAEAMARLGDTDALQAVRAALYPGSDEEYEAAVLAAQILGEMKDRAAVRELVTRIDERADQNYSTPPELRLAAAGALAKMGYRDGAYVAEQYSGSEFAPQRAQAAYVFGETVGPEGLGRLELMMDDQDPQVQLAAAAAIIKVVDRIARQGR